MIGEGLNNVEYLGGKVVSVTTDGFCTNLDVDPKKDLFHEKSIENDVSNGIVNDVSNLECKLLTLDKSQTTFLERTQKERLELTSGIEGLEPNASV